jgi:hypothetical protein
LCWASDDVSGGAGVVANGAVLWKRGSGWLACSMMMVMAAMVVATMVGGNQPVESE